MPRACIRGTHHPSAIGGGRAPPWLHARCSRWRRSASAVSIPGPKAIVELLSWLRLATCRELHFLVSWTYSRAPEYTCGRRQVGWPNFFRTSRSNPEKLTGRGDTPADNELPFSAVRLTCGFALHLYGRLSDLFKCFGGLMESGCPRNAGHLVNTQSKIFCRNKIVDGICRTGHFVRHIRYLCDLPYWHSKRQGGMSSCRICKFQP